MSILVIAGETLKVFRNFLKVLFFWFSELNIQLSEQIKEAFSLPSFFFLNNLETSFPKLVLFLAAVPSQCITVELKCDYHHCNA